MGKVRDIRKTMKMAFEKSGGNINFKTLNNIKKTVAKKIAQKIKKVKAMKRIKILIKNKGSSKKVLKKVKKILKKNNIKNAKKFVKIIKKNPDNLKKIMKKIKKKMVKKNKKNKKLSKKKAKAKKVSKNVIKKIA